MSGDRRKRITMIMWGSLALAIAATLWWRLATRGEDGSGEVKYRCVPAGPRQVECVFEADRDAPGVCVGLELACDDGSHKARVCSDALTKGVAKSVVLTDLSPPLPAKPHCSAPVFSDVEVQPSK